MANALHVLMMNGVIHVCDIDETIASLTILYSIDGMRNRQSLLAIPLECIVRNDT